MAMQAFKQDVEAFTDLGVRLWRRLDLLYISVLSTSVATLSGNVLGLQPVLKSLILVM